jgi:hypothetical protein
MIERLRLALARIGLPAWFIVIDLLWIAKPEVLGIDAHHYQRAASVWLAGGDPYGVYEGSVPYLAGPHTLLFYAPTSLLPLSASVVVWMVMGLAASVWLVRRLDLPLWWLAFPPLAHSIWNGNPQTVALALLLTGGSIAAALGVALKLYTGLALVFRPRALVVTGILLVATMPLVPWQAYLAQGPAISTHLSTAWNGSAWRLPILIPPTLLGMWVLRRGGAEWFAVPSIWPATQFYYVAMALPALVGRPVVAAALALPVPLMTPIIVMILAALEVRRSRLADPRGGAAPSEAQAPILHRP